MPSVLKVKTVYLNNLPIGAVATWNEVAHLLSDTLERTVSMREAQDRGSEGRDAFYIAMPHLRLISTD